MERIKEITTEGKREEKDLLILFWSTTEKSKAEERSVSVLNVHVCRLHSLLKDVLCVHPSVILGQFDGEDDAGNQEDAAASQTKPECVLKNTITQLSTPSFKLILNWLLPHISRMCGSDIVKNKLNV